MAHGLLLIQLGTPDSPEKPAVRAYLKAFLGDPLVLEMPALFRWLLLHGIILPFRTPKTTKLYQKIWTSDSPLRIHSLALKEACQQTAQIPLKVALGMRYGNPPIQAAVEELKDCSTITVLPLFPQYAQSSSKTALLEAKKYLKPYFAANDIHWIEDFHDHPAFIEAQASLIQDDLSDFEDAHLLFSFHGIPKHHEKPHQPSYEAQCRKTAQILAQKLQRSPESVSVAFQSRVGKAPWIGPELNQQLKTLRQQGITRLALAAPSFVADCLETLEELDIRAKDTWLALGGTHFRRVPCLNSDGRWVQAVLEIAGECTP